MIFDIHFYFRYYFLVQLFESGVTASPFIQKYGYYYTTLLRIITVILIVN